MRDKNGKKLLPVWKTVCGKLVCAWTRTGAAIELTQLTGAHYNSETFTRLKGLAASGKPRVIIL